MWSAVRWQTFYLMMAQVGTKAMHESNIFKPDDLLQFPWDKEPAPPITDEERDELQAEIDRENKAAGVKL